jgi:hypothetical protein
MVNAWLIRRRGHSYQTLRSLCVQIRIEFNRSKGPLASRAGAQRGQLGRFITGNDGETWLKVGNGIVHDEEKSLLVGQLPV